jgi:branched-chain amino acid transport system permease protein/urea transport system permease protein
MAEFLTFALDASNYILILILVALGLAIIFGLMNVINMAHGEFLMLGAYSVLVVQNAGGSFWLGLLLAPVIVGLIGLVIEELIISRIYHRVLDTILATWGLSLLIKQAVVLFYGPGSYSINVPLQAKADIFGSPYPIYRLFIMGLSVAVVGFTFWLFFKTRYGLAARGVIANRNMADCLGINTRRLDRQTFFFGSAMAGLAGAAMSPLISLDPQMGLGFLVPGFLAILIGGLGTIAGPLIGAGTVGLSDNLATTLLSPVWAQLIVFVIAIVLIRLFPRGLLAKKGREL